MIKNFPRIGYGVYNVSRSQTSRCVMEALETGYRLIDTAALYGNEKETAQGIRDFLLAHPEVKRNEIVYVSKLWDDSFGSSTEHGFEDSYDNAGEPIDLYLMHSSGDGPRERKETWQILERKVADGKIRHLGVSNWGVKHLQELEKYANIKPVVNQIEVNPWKQMDELVDYCAKKGIHIMVYSPLTMGKTLKNPQLLELGSKYNKSPAQIQLRYLVQRNLVPIPKTTNKERMVENMDIFDFKLTDLEMKNLGDPGSYIMAIPGWDPTEWA